MVLIKNILWVIKLKETIMLWDAIFLLDYVFVWWWRGSERWSLNRPEFEWDRWPLINLRSFKENSLFTSIQQNWQYRIEYFLSKASALYSFINHPKRPFRESTIAPNTNLRYKVDRINSVHTKWNLFGGLEIAFCRKIELF